MGQPDHLDPRILLLAGATAAGKSEVALRLAEQLNGEIISVDSMQVYRGLDIGTAKPSAADRRRVPHHLIDVVDVTEAFDAAKFVRLARNAVREIQSRGRLPVFCGGTGLYFNAFLQGLGEAPPADDALRAELAAAPLAELVRELEQCDPATFARIDRQNPRRVIRAVEVIRLTGKPFSIQRADWAFLNPTRNPQPATFFGLARQTADLHSRINARVELMFQRGLVAETKNLLQHGLAENKFALQAIGYRQAVEHLRGERNLPGTIELVKIRTRQFAKRQMTWFRKHAQLKWIDCGPQDNAALPAEKITALFRSE
jgi:tRNA dimethylallyltransferase